MHFQMAWRNIWRNPRRTMVILTAIIIGVWSMIFLGALMRGMEVGMIQNGLSTLTGNLQIHHENYRRDPVVENSIHNPEIFETLLPEKLPPEALWTTRVRVNAIAANARHSSSITMVGIDPPREATVSFIGKAVNQGRYLDPTDHRHVLVGQALLEKMETKVGHKVILMSQDTTGEIASKAFRITGSFRAETQAVEKQFVFVTREAAQGMLKLGTSISEVAVVLPGGNALMPPGDNAEYRLAATLKTALDALPSGTKLAVETWPELLPILKAYLSMFDGFIYIWYLVVFIAMGFGIVNTTLMAVFERMREFGLLKALGLRPLGIIRGIMTESFLQLLIGMAIGNLLGFICIWGLAGHGIDLSAFAAGTEMWGMSRVVFPIVWVSDIFVANLTVFILGMVVSIYPASKAARFTPVEALAQT